MSIFDFFRRSKDKEYLEGNIPRMKKPLPPPGSKKVKPDNNPGFAPMGNMPHGRQSIPISDLKGITQDIKDSYNFVNPDFNRDMIPVIRRLVMYHEEVGLAVNDIVTLATTQHRVSFSSKTSAEQQDRIRTHLKEVSKNWSDGTPMLATKVHKLFAQLLIGGALSGEWIPRPDLKGLQNMILVDPETIYFKYHKATTRFKAYQKVGGSILPTQGSKGNLKPLNDHTYRYIALNGDRELPYGTPPFLKAFRAIATQDKMLDNIDNIMELMGLLGFLTTLIEVPQTYNGQESDKQYARRVKSALAEARKEVEKGMKSGLITGLKDQHKFEFHSTSQNLNGVSEVYDMIQQKLANALTHPGSFIGLGEKAESAMGIVFSKMLSQLTLMQTIVASFLSYGYSLELQMAGFQFDGLEVEFEATTVTDILKYQQAQEIKIRNLSKLRVDGIISQDKYAEGVGQDKPFSPEPMIPFEQQAGNGGGTAGDNSDDEVKRKKKETDKDTGDRKSREKKKETPKRKDQKSV